MQRPGGRTQKYVLGFQERLIQGIKDLFTNEFIKM